MPETAFVIALTSAISTLLSLFIPLIECPDPDVRRVLPTFLRYEVGRALFAFTSKDVRGHGILRLMGLTSLLCFPEDL